MRTDSSGRGMVNILVADKLMSSPKLYSTFLLWMLSELFEELPEVGDPAKPKLVFSSTKPICCLTMRPRR
jgi:DNA helicase HerA-like ATPase